MEDTNSSVYYYIGAITNWELSRNKNQNAEKENVDFDKCFPTKSCH